MNLFETETKLNIFFVSKIIYFYSKFINRAQFAENRSIFNTPNPRLMNVSLLKDSKLFPNQRSQRSRRVSRVSSSVLNAAAVAAAGHLPQEDSLQTIREEDHGRTQMTSPSPPPQKIDSRLFNKKVVCLPCLASICLFATNIKNPQNAQQQQQQLHIKRAETLEQNRAVAASANSKTALENYF